MLSNFAWNNRIVLPALAVLLSGCGLNQTVADGGASVTRSLFYKQVKILRLDFTAREALNTDAGEENSASLPVMVRIYQLRDDKNFRNRVYQQLADNGDNALKEDVLAGRSLVVKPGTAASLNMPMEKDARFVAIVGLFRQPEREKNRWRLVLARGDLHPDKPRTIELGNNGLTLRAEKQ
ncbi:type VI secretion system lipoprotein TssJ [Acerihabitans sp.]|uniref:type VI secretion system lipoprotein TssJ n=1 Tax=Acerihabitans sp. TaxID=2811394 RepID=UPI002ED8FCAD